MAIRFLYRFSTNLMKVENYKLHARLLNDKAIKDLVDITQLGDLDDDVESDFMEVHKTHKQHLKDVERDKEVKKQLIVKQKYFKEKLPNFLTWCEKEQIRYLHRTEPDHWTIEQLSESFPATLDIIKKIVKANWSKQNENKIKNHDGAVEKNWKLLKEGKIENLSKDLKEHLEKFSNRNKILDITPVNKKQLIDPKTTKHKSDFFQIIESYQTNKNKEEVQKDIVKWEQTDELLPEMKSSKKIHVPLKILKPSLQTVNTEVPTELQNTESVQDEFQITDLTLKKANAVMTKLELNTQALSYPEQIIIPKKLLKRGQTYKLNDCYYHDDGTFLYRVPGLVS